LFILVWSNTESPIVPPLVYRVSSERIMVVFGLSGYTDVGAYATKIPYQTFLFASVQSGAADDPQGMDPSQLITQP